jgi:hypothetical protein
VNVWYCIDRWMASLWRKSSVEDAGSIASESNKEVDGKSVEEVIVGCRWYCITGVSMDGESVEEVIAGCWWYCIERWMASSLWYVIVGMLVVLHREVGWQI